MSTQAIAERPGSIPIAQAVENVLVGGDLSRLTTEQRVSYYQKVCQSLGLNPYTKPFAYLTLNNKLQLYALRDATDQLRKLHTVSIEIVSRELVEELYVVRARARIGERTDESLGAVNLKGLSGEGKANALMKAETKAKRRVTLSICGLGWLDETEAEDIPQPMTEKQPRVTPGELAAVEAAEEANTEILDTPMPPEAEVEPVPNLPVGQYLIRAVHQRKQGTKNGRAWTLFGIVVHTGEELSTFDANIADAADRAQRDGWTVDIVTEKKRFGLEIVTFTPVFQQDDEKIF